MHSCGSDRAPFCAVWLLHLLSIDTAMRVGTAAALLHSLHTFLTCQAQCSQPAALNPFLYTVNAGSPLPRSACRQCSRHAEQGRRQHVQAQVDELRSCAVFRVCMSETSVVPNKI